MIDYIIVCLLYRLITQKTPLEGGVNRKFNNRIAPAMIYFRILLDTIVDAGTFHDSVRNGKRWGHPARITEAILLSIFKVRFIPLRPKWATVGTKYFIL